MIRGFLFTSLFLVILSINCTHSEKHFHPDAASDKDYAPLLEQETIVMDVYDDLTRLYKISATRLSETMRKAIIDRHQRLYQVDASDEIGDSKIFGFFISLESADRDFFDLFNKKLWTLFLEVSPDVKIASSKVIRMDDKLRWKAFFTQISDFSQDYLVLFDSQDIRSGPMSLSLNHQKLRSTLKWKN